MVPVWWSIALAAIGILGIFLAGSKRKVGWAIGFIAQPLWIIYAVSTSQWGFIPMSLAYGGVYARNWLLWRKGEKE